MKTIGKILDLLNYHERKQTILLLLMILVMAVLDVVGVASILPFIAVLSNPELMQTNSILNAIYSSLNFNNPQQFLFALGIVVFVLLVVSLAFKALTTYAQLRFSLMREYSIGERLMKGYLHQPYSWFLGRHSADLGKNIVSEVSTVINNVIMPVMNIFAQGSVAIAILLLLIITDPQLALIIGITLGASYGFAMKFTSGYLVRIGNERYKANEDRFKAINEAFSASKEVKIAGLEEVYIDRYNMPARIYARHQASASVVAQLPRFLLEAIAFGGLVIMILYLMNKNGDFTATLPIIAMYAFAGYRLMPALQQIYTAVTQLRFAGPALDALHTDLMSLGQIKKLVSEKTTAMQLKREISLKNAFYCYPSAQQATLKGIDFTICANTTVGLVGSTGSGKTTTVDLILGLLEPQQGMMMVDGQPINDLNRKAWQRCIGYVPQQIFLSDDTIAANIAFGTDPENIDQSAVVRAAKIANLHEFVVNELPNQYQTTVGERGVRLSGGQRQRIGIARALYHNPQVLILDEATSALDNLTEKAVMDAVHNLGHEITIIMIAHRLSTVKKCDTIFLLDKGELKAQGTYEELSAKSNIFQKMSS